MTEPTKAVFLSYASQDAEAARRICEALRAGGIEVWFDQSELRGGDVWDQKIRREVHDCALFIPVISANTASRHEGYFRLEWNLADQRTQMMARDRAFIVPVCIDGTPDSGTDVPESFVRVQWSRLPGGETLPAFVVRVSQLLSPRQAHAPAQAHSSTPPAPAPLPPAPSPAASRRTPHVLLLIAAVVVIGLGYLAVDKFILSKRPAAGVQSFAPSSQPTAVGQRAIPEKSIAVLPFVDMSEKKDQEYFSDGLSEELIDLLTQVPDLRVPARTSSFYFKGKSTTIAEIAKTLNVSHVLEGSVRKVGHTVRITAQLIRADNGYHLWSETYERDLNDIFKLQDEIAGNVVRSLKLALLTTLPRGERATHNLDAYTLLMQGRFLNGRETETDARQAVQFLEHSLTLDPSYAAAWAELSGSYWFLAYAGAEAAAFGQARTAAEKAVALDQTSAAAHEALAVVRMYESDWQAAGTEYEAARKADPITPRPNWVPTHLGCVTGPCHAELIQDLTRLIDRDPLNASTYDYRANAHFFAGELTEAERDARRALELSPNLAGGRANLVQILIARRDLDGLVATAAVGPLGSQHRFALALAYGAAGPPTEAQQSLQEFTEQDARCCAYQIAVVYAARQNSATALAWLERAYRQHDYSLAWLKVEPFLASLHGNPRYQALQRKMNLSE